MSQKAIDWVIRESQSKKSTYLVLLVIASKIKPGYCGGALVSYTSLSRQTRLSYSTVYLAIKKLISMRELSIEASSITKIDIYYSLPKMAKKQ